jgi:Predicted membrane protein (DUF2207)
MRERRFRTALLALALAALPAAVTRADERILAWESDIQVRPDSTLEVTETLRMRAEGERIRRGIYRDFPTRYTDRRGARVVTGFDVQGVTRDARERRARLDRRRRGAARPGRAQLHAPLPD